MTTRLFIDNLPPGTTEEALRALFAGTGDAVVSVVIMIDRRNGDSHGYGFVEMTTEAAAAHATKVLHGHRLRGVPLHVSQARPRTTLSKAAR